MKRAALYVRVSTEDQKNHGLSIDSQLTALQDYCKDNNYTVAGIYNDAGISARKSYKKRPGLLKMIEDCQKNKIDIVLFTKLDRFFRSVSDYYACIEQMNNVPWKCIWEDYETETSNGVFKVNIMLSVAQSEADRTSERIKSVNEYRRLQGKYVGGKAPTGYLKKDSGLIKDPNTVEAVSAFFETYASTFSMIQSRNVAASYGFPIARATAVRMLHNTAYYGDASGYACEPYITREQFELNNKEMARFSRTPKWNEGNYIFSGLIICNSCGGHFTSKYGYDIMNDGTKKLRFGYNCAKARNKNLPCSMYLGQITLEKYLLDNLDRIIEETNIISKSKNKNINTNRIKTLNNKLERLTLLFEEGDISIDKYREKRDSIKSELEALSPIQLTSITQMPDNWKEVYKTLDGVHKRAFWHRIIDKILIDKTIKKNPIVILK